MKEKLVSMNEEKRVSRSDPPAAMSFDKEEIERYDRQLVLPEIGIEGQRRLKAASVLIVGAGGLGSAAALHLAAAGIGRLGIVDPDAVELSNLHRQLLHHTPDVGRPKAVSAAETIASLNPNVKVATHQMKLTRDNAEDLLRTYDVAVDGTDNYTARYDLNDACFSLGIPVVYGAVFRFEGQTSVFDPSGGPCYRCLYPEPPPPESAPSCADAGVICIVPGVIGILQAGEVIKLILSIGRPLVGRLLVFDALAPGFQELRIHRNPCCPLCGSGRNS